MPDTRKFIASFSVRIDTRRVRFELAPAPDYGGPRGFCRVRAGRCWLNGPAGESLFFDRDRLARLIADAALGTLPKPAPAPTIPPRSRVCVRLWQDDDWRQECGWTLAPAIQGVDGRWMVPVSLFDGLTYVPVNDVFLREAP